MKKKTTITQQMYLTLDDAFAFFNKKLFDGELPQTMITLQRKNKRNHGYFHAKRFVNLSDVRTKKKNKEFVDEIALNPDQWITGNTVEIFQTLVHEMCHSWQRNTQEKQPRGGYHDKVWGRKMQEVGLMPSATSAPGGKQTGQQMSDYVIEGGKFQKLVLDLLKTKSINYSSFPLLSAAASEKKNKVKYVCPACGSKVWGKPSMNIDCADCEERYEEQ